MNNQFSPRVNQILIYSKEEAERLQSRTIEPGHLFLGMLRENSGKAIEILNKFHLRLDDIKRGIEEQLNEETGNTRTDIFSESYSHLHPQKFLEAELLKCVCFTAVALTQSICCLPCLKTTTTLFAKFLTTTTLHTKRFINCLP